MNKILIIALTVLTTNFYASTAERLQKVKERVLIVELPVKDEEYIKHLQKKGRINEISIYETDLANVRNSIKIAFSKFWTLNERIEYVSSDTIRSFINGYTNMYAIIRYGDRGTLKLDENFKVRNFSGSIVTNFTLYLTDEPNEILFITNPLRQNVSSFIYSVHQFNSCIEVMFKYPEIKATSVQGYTTSKGDKAKFETKNLTLLIDKNDLKEETFDMERLTKVYPYKFKIVETKEIEDAMLSRDPNYACIIFMVMLTHTTTHTDDNHDGNRYNDFAHTEPAGIPFFAVCVTKDGHMEAGSTTTKLEKMFIDIKKMLDKTEAKANKSN